MTDETPTRATPTEAIRTEPAPQPKQLAPPFWEMLPKTIPHTRARTSTVILSVLFIGLLWWYLTLYDEFVPKDVQQGRAPAAATTTAPRDTEPVNPAPTRAPTTTAAPSSEAPTSSGRPSASGAPSTVPGRAESAAPGGPATTTTPGGTVPPGGATLPLPPGPASAGAASDGAPTTTVPPG